MSSPTPSGTATVYPPMKEVKRMMLTLLEEFREGSYSGKMITMGRLREYVRKQNPYVLQDEIKGIDNEQDINVLIGVGMKGFLYYEVIKQKAKCIGL